MKKVLSAVLFFISSYLAADDAALKVLMVGNSFSLSCGTYPPKAAQSAGCKLDLEVAYIGGCSLRRHIEEYEKTEKNPDHRPYGSFGKKRVSLQELLSMKKWDIVTIQQASHLSWRDESYQPWADRLMEIVRKYNPQAEIAVQETWSYNGGDGRFAKLDDRWSVDQNTMFVKLDANYRKLAKDRNLRIIPVGVAVQMSRRDSPRQLPAIDAKYLESLVHPCELPETLDVVGKCGWKKRPDGKIVATADTIHLNEYGQYLQACVWFGFLFDRPVSDITYYPPELDRNRLEKLRGIAQQALDLEKRRKKTSR
ncbi:MAG: DUF4886 domain-containing protein [Victivallaceae bacterium]|nr:DUF4886 domain-containing protein [Victivallaceae bacterium]